MKWCQGGTELAVSGIERVWHGRCELNGMYYSFYRLIY
jgi:hypothetical protein